MQPNNPYDFLNDPVKQKRSLLPSTSSKKQRLIVASAGALILIMLAVIVMGIISNSGKGPKEDLLGLAQQQAEIIRVTEIGLKKANGADAKSLAVTTKFTVLSQQPEVQAMAKKSGVKTDEKSLAAGKDAKTDSTLTAAEQSNQFDEVFTSTLKTKLLNYRRALEKVRSQMGSSKSRKTLKAYDEQIIIIVPNEAVPAS